MSLVKLDVTNVRNLEKLSLAPASSLNFLIGPNGSGKTSLIEAIYILGRGRSFRSSQAGQIIRFQQDSLTVAGRADDESGGPTVNLGVRLGRRQREIMLAGRKLQSSAELIAALPILLIQPTSSALLDNAPKYRRQFLDWGVFHIEPDYLEQWRGYARALNQRNALLRQGDWRQIERTWNHELSRYGTIVAAARDRYVQRLAPYFVAATEHFLGIGACELRSATGWDRDRSLEDVLQQDAALDRKHGYTHSGAHKGDFSIHVDGRPAKNFLSRGQMKMLVFALLLSQAHLLEEAIGRRGCVLIDDLASELDDANRSRLLQYLQKRNSQFFITATDTRAADAIQSTGSAVFHVDGGQVTRTR